MYFPVVEVVSVAYYIEICLHIHKWLQTRFIVNDKRFSSQYLWLGFHFLSPFHCSRSLPPSCSLPQALHLCGLSACFFIWLVATGGSALADYNSPASHFDLSELSVPPPPSPTPRSRPVGINPHAHTYSHLSDPPSISLLLHLSPSLPSSLFRLARKCSSRAQRQKRNIVSGEAFKLEEAARVVLLLRALSPPMTPESGEYRSLVTQSIQQIALTKLVEAFNSKVSSLGGGPGEKSNWAPLHGGFLTSPPAHRVDW